MFNLIIEEEIPEDFDETPETGLRIEDLPVNFDAREKWPECESIKDVLDQSACGACWAFGAAEAISDRICIHSGQKDQRRVSVEDLLECCEDCGYGCNGGFLMEAWRFWRFPGIVTGSKYKDNSSCKPYKFPECQHHTKGKRKDCHAYHFRTPRCLRSCENPDYKLDYKKDRIRGGRSYVVRGEDQMLKELVKNGPIEVAIMVYQDFVIYQTGVYQHTRGAFMGFHAIKIIGYGVEKGVKYWLCVNSWNFDWGDKGMLKILRGVDHLGIEHSGVAGLPL